jgi:hypothetical protein
MGHRQFLDVVDPVRQRVMVGVFHADPQHVKDYLGLLGIVLVSSRHSSRRDPCMT